MVTYIFVALVIVLVICMIDFTEKIEYFRKSNGPTTSEIIVDYYLNLIPYWLTLISPLMVFISTTFFTARMAARTEIVAILSSGVSFLRMLRPYFMGAVILASVTFYLVGWVIPKANAVRLGFENKYIEAHYYFNKRNFHIKIAPQTYAYLERYDNDIKTGHKFTLERVEGNQLKEKLVSSQIVWDSTKTKWTIQDYRIRKIEGEKETLTTGSRLDTTLNLSPKDFENDKNQYEAMTLSQLNEHIGLLKLRGSDGLETYQLEKYTRFTQPFAMIILTAIGALVSARKNRRGTGWQIAMGFVLAFVYLVFFMLSKSIGESGKIPPVLAVWLPNIVFSIIGMVLYKTLPR